MSAPIVRRPDTRPGRADLGADRPELRELCEHLADRVEGNGFERPAIGKAWIDAARLMLDADGREAAKIHNAIDWVQDHAFWYSNIRSMPTLRRQYDRLRLESQRGADRLTRAHDDPRWRYG